MDYKIVNLDEKTVIGVTCVTGKNDPKMNEKISGLWTKLYQDGINAVIKNKVNEYAIGLYSDYKDDEYVVTVGNEVSKVDNQDLAIKIIPAGKYAKFSIHGDMVTAVQKAWDEIWKMELDRRFSGDFEEYLNSDFKNADIDIYIALN